MLKIRVLGSGLIPRIGTLAPKKEPFLADANLIQIILYTKGLKPQYFDPEKQTFVDLTLVAVALDDNHRQLLLLILLVGR